MCLYENQSGLVHLVDGLYQSDRLSDLCIACNQSILVQNVQKQSFQASERVLLLYIYHSRGMLAYGFNFMELKPYIRVFSVSYWV